MEQQVILLNGPSSSGKSTLAKALQELIANEGHGRCEVISIDDLLRISSTKEIYEDDVFEISDDLCKRALELLEAGSSVIIDHVITSERIFNQLTEKLSSYPIRMVHITCPSDILKSRELARGDRCIGSAEASAEYLFPKEGYDLVVDTGTKSPAENARLIFNELSARNFEILSLTEEEEELIEKKINEYADSMAPAKPHTEEEQLVFKIADEERNVIGGCVVNIHAWGRAVLAQLWVDEQYRHHGLGSMLIRAAEDAAREKGCYYLCLGTLDFMARPLYEKHGFKVFTVNNDLPRGHMGWSLSKRLDKDIPAYTPSDNSAEERYQVDPGGKEDAKIIDEGLDRFCDQFIAPNDNKDIPLNKKLVDKDGNMIAAVLVEVDADKSTDVNGVWVEEPYRKQGIGSYLLEMIEREAKENGAYLLIGNACDWNIDFFKKNGYIVRGELEDYPKGHTAYEIEKRIQEWR